MEYKASDKLVLISSNRDNANRGSTDESEIYHCH